jgi:hypothetical protein
LQTSFMLAASAANVPISDRFQVKAIRGLSSAEACVASDNSEATGISLDSMIWDGHGTIVWQGNRKPDAWRG